MQPRNAFVDLATLNREQLLQMRADTEADLANIKAQLDAAGAVWAATGVYADPNWYRRAKVAARYKGALHQRINAQLSVINRATKEENIRRSAGGHESIADGHSAFLHAFIRAAKLELDPEVFQALSSSAQRAVDTGPPITCSKCRKPAALQCAAE
jgi:hypothetical protein